jgi:hypothetical protein
MENKNGVMEQWSNGVMKKFGFRLNSPLLQYSTNPMLGSLCAKKS